MYEKINGGVIPIRNRFADRDKSEGANRNFKSSSQLQNVYQSITPSNNNQVRLGSVPKDKEYQSNGYSQNFKPLSIGKEA